MEEHARAGSRRRAAIGVTIGLLALLIGAPASADTELGESGRTGPHLLVDTPVSPGGRCDYAVSDAGLRFAQMEIQPPVVYPAGSRIRQKVSWAVRLQRKRPGGGWRTKLTTDATIARATRTVPARFTSSWVTWSIAGDVQWRAIIDLTWLHEGLPKGTSSHRIDHYGIGDSMEVQDGRCPNRLTTTAGPGPTDPGDVAGRGAMRRD